MLQIKNISKQYKTGEFVQDALKDVSLNLRENKFVAILGPSGSGKTTLLNIIGGQTAMTADLIIDGISTKTIMTEIGIHIAITASVLFSRHIILSRISQFLQMSNWR